MLGLDPKQEFNRWATHLNVVHVAMLLPAITVSTSPTLYWPVNRCS